MTRSKISLTKRFQKILIRHSPKWLRHHLLRKDIRFNYDLPSDLNFKVAETQDELNQAFSVVHKAYLTRNLVGPNSKSSRITKYHAVPSSTILIAKYRGQVIGTLSVLGNSPLGLPIEQLWDIEHLKSPTRNIVEISSFAIAKDLPIKKDLVRLSLIRFLFRYLTESYKADMMVISTHPKGKDFYAAILGFQPINTKVKQYNFVNGAKAYAQFLELSANTFNKWALSVSKDTSKDRNVHEYFVSSKFEKNMSLPEGINNSTKQPIYTPELLDYFFNQVESVFKGLKRKEREDLKSLYENSASKSVIDRYVPKSKVRGWPRFSTQLIGKLSDQANSGECSITSVSMAGINLKSGKSLNIGAGVKTSIFAGFKKNIELEVVPVWADEDGNYGCRVLGFESNLLWRKLVKSLNASSKIDDDKNLLIVG